MKKILLLLCCISVFIQCKQSEPKAIVGLLADNGMVVSAREEASTIGVDILKQGGNAFDAMVATDLALAVAYPRAGNIGGGGFMVYRTADGKTGALDYREKAPLAAYDTMYLDSIGNIIQGKSLLGANAVGVPGTIAGLFAVHKKFGKLPFKTLIQPAIDLAYKGIKITKKQAINIQDKQADFINANKDSIYFNGTWKAGDVLLLSELAQTLERIRDHGRDEFYTGETALHIVQTIQDLGGIITLEDLAKYEAIWRTPITFNYKDLTITSMTLPSSGGICMAQILKSIAPYDISEITHNSEKYVQLITEAERRAYADRAHFLGDIDFVNVPMDSLTSQAYLNHRMSDFTWEKATKSSSISRGNIPGYESDETTHYSIVDSEGNAVAVTTTLNMNFGSKVFVQKGGFFLNNEMDDFSSKPGTPNGFGLIGAKANEIKPEKRMLSSMTPTIVEKDGKLFMVVGSPGGSTIITSVMQNILNVYEYDMGMQASVVASRFHHQWLPDEILMEPNGFDQKTKAALITKGYHISEKKSPIIGKVDAILVLENGQLEAGADPRGDDSAKGY